MDSDSDSHCMRCKCLGPFVEMVRTPTVVEENSEGKSAKRKVAATSRACCLSVQRVGKFDFSLAKMCSREPEGGFCLYEQAKRKLANNE